MAVASTPGRVVGVRLLPEDPPACEPAVAAVRAADWIVLGPGSWFTSVLPHLLVPELAAALHQTPARRCVTLNLASHERETAGFGAQTYLEVLGAHAPDLRVDAVLADPSSVDDAQKLADMAAAMGARLVLREVRVREGGDVHDPLLLAAAYRDVFAG